MQLSRDVLVASIQVDLNDDVLARFKEDLLGLVHETSPRAVILDVSGLETLDSEEFAALRQIILMVKIMGTESVLVGLQPGVVSALIEVGADVGGLQTAIDLDAAFALLEPEPEPEFDGGAADDDDADPDSGLDADDTPEALPDVASEQIFEDER